MRIDLSEIASSAAPYWVPEELPRLLGKLNLRRATLLTIGKSREGRSIHGLRIGQGPQHISLIAGAHADEPVGPVTLLHLCRWLTAAGKADEILEKATFFVCPQINPDGAHRNASWTAKEQVSLEEHLKGCVREEPGDDIEFGFPHEHAPPRRPENKAVADFLRPWGPFAFHASLHGMAIGEGAWFLINREKVDATQDLRVALCAVTQALGLPLHDWDRHGEKGFARIAPGFSTTPTSTAMKEHFHKLNDSAKAELFLHSSMEFVARLGGDPLTMVSEIPLFLVKHSRPGASVACENFLEVKDRLISANMHRATGNSAPLDVLKKRFGFRRVPLETAVQLQLAILFLGSGLATAADLLPAVDGVAPP